VPMHCEWASRGNTSFIALYYPQDKTVLTKSQQMGSLSEVQTSGWRRGLHSQAAGICFS